jgi:hypothetical protein
MRLIALLLLLLIAALGCNLSSSPPPLPTVEDIEAPAETEGASPPLLATITIVSDDTQPTLPPLPNISVTSAPSLGSQCQVYVTYSGVNADNKLSMRMEPSPSAPQIFRVPNNTQVFLVPGSQEVEAEGYHWLYVLYVDSPEARYQGWIARDSFETNGVRDPSIATLRDAGTLAPC